MVLMVLVVLIALAQLSLFLPLLCCC